MKTTHTSLILWVLSLFCPSILFSQIQFEPGYFIDNEGVKQECLIKNLDWLNNPTKISYKISEAEPSQLKGISQLQEFGFNSGRLKYIRAEVRIDRSSDSQIKASYQSEPEWSAETLFLKYEIEGELSLFSYSDKKVLRYFYQNKDENIIQMVNKPYFKKGSSGLYWNRKFRQTLWTKLNCSGKSSESYVSIQYETKSLKKYFIEENQCRGSEVNTYRKKKAREFLKLKIAPGIKIAQLDLKNLSSELYSVYFDQKTSARFGLELEYVLPFSNNKLSLFTEPTLQIYQAEHVSDTGTYSIDYKSIEVPVGLRHYFFLNPKSAVFINVAFTVDLSLGETFVRFNGITSNGYESEELKLFPAWNFDYGLGFMYANKFSMEFRYHGDRQTMFKTFWDAPYSGISLIFRYTFL